ncbi:MAG: transposase [Proteobacteria bacterium]|nr:transposase [Pseudomonadota bacterium]
MNIPLSTEVCGADFGDARLSKRHGVLVDRLAERPEASLPSALSSAELEAAYRFINHEGVTLPTLVAPHLKQVAERCAGRPDIIVAHDTSEIEYSGAARKGLGRLRSKGQGFYLHAALAIGGSQVRDPLGLIALRALVRGPKRPKQRATRRRCAADRESLRWTEQIQEVEQRLGQGRALHVGDRETDAYELFVDCIRIGARFVFRMAHDRRIAGEEDGTTKLEQRLRGVEGVAVREVKLHARGKALAPSAAKMECPEFCVRAGGLAT